MVEKGIKGKELVSYVVAKWERLKRERTDKESTWNECIAAYMSQIAADSDVKEFRSQRPQPNAFEAVENVTALLGVGLFPNDRFCMAVGENPQAEFFADERTRYMQNRLEKMQYVEKYVGQHLKQLMVIGNSPRLLKWSKKRSRRRVSSYDFMGSAYGSAAPSAYRKSANDYDGQDFDVLDMFNFVFDPKSSDMESKLKIYRLKVSVGDLISDAEDGIYDKKAVLKAIDGRGGDKHEPSDSDEEARSEAFGLQSHKKDADEDEVEAVRRGERAGPLSRRGLGELSGEVVPVDRRYLAESSLLEKKRKERIERDITKLVEARLARYVYEQMRGMQSLGSMIDLVCSRRDDPYSCAERMLKLLDKRPYHRESAAINPQLTKGADDESYQAGSYRHCSQKH